MTDEWKNMILGIHNELRNEFAQGKYAGYEKANRMGTVEWDDELTYFADLNTKRCQYGHDACHPTEEWQYTGQNIAFAASTGELEPVKSMTQKLTHVWFDEYKVTDMSYLARYQPGPDRPWVLNFTFLLESLELTLLRFACSHQNGHFAQMVQERATRVGCSVIKYKQEGKNWYYYVCNYNWGILSGLPIYQVGEPTTGCKSGANPQYPALCSMAEEYTIEELYTIARKYQ